jgi:hypothetical protein
MNQREKIYAQVDMYLSEAFPGRVEFEDGWVLTQEPHVTARVFPTGLTDDFLPKYFFSVEGELLDGVKDTHFLHKYVTMMNSSYHHAKFTLLKSGKKLAVYSVITVPADDLQAKEIMYALFMTATFAELLPPRIERAIKTKSLA